MTTTDPRPTSRARSVRVARGLTSLASQGFNAFAGFALLTVVGIGVDADIFGIVALVSAGHVVVIGLNQALVSEPVVVARASDGDRRAVSAVAGEVCARAAVIGLIVGCCVAGVVAATTPAPAEAIGLVVAVACAGSVADGLRAVVIASHPPAKALAVDVALFFGQGLGVAGALATIGPSVSAALLGWLVGPVLSASVAAMIVRPASLQLDAPRWLAGRSGKLGWSLAVEAGAIAGSQFLLVFMIGNAEGIDVGGHVRYALSILGPVSVLFTTFRFFGLGWIAVGARTRRGAMIVASRISAASALAAFAYGGVLWLAADEVDALTQSDLIAGSFVFLWAVTFNKVAVGLCLGPTLTLRTQYRVLSGLIARTSTAALGVGLAWLALTRASAETAVYAFSAAWVLQAVVLFALEWTGPRRAVSEGSDD